MCLTYVTRKHSKTSQTKPTMNYRTVLKSTLSVPMLSLMTASAFANLSPDPVEMHVHLAHEDVHCVIKEDEAVITGTFTFDRQPQGFNVPVLYLPVYAEEGTPVKQMMPTITVDGVKMDIHLVQKRWENNEDIRKFGQLPQMEGQRVYWFYVNALVRQAAPIDWELERRHARRQAAPIDWELELKGKRNAEPGDDEPVEVRIAEVEPEPAQLTVKIRYHQKLSKGKFIYTPLIPNQKKDKDYGSITVSADRKLTLLDADKHSFVEEKGKFIIEPSHKHAIVVQAAKEAASQIP